ncbi:hypothetical protein BC941DRAFT_434869 [Chlamydoabsidia padenii]|nr:hypothetical protein BC941DRAFT_434869 [Chlamydoabsidia padenii]
MDQLKARKKVKRTDDSSIKSTNSTTTTTNSNSNKKKNSGRKAKQQEDMKLLSTARSFPELISAHNSYTTSNTASLSIISSSIGTKEQPSLVSSSSTSSSTSSITSSSPPVLSTSPSDSITSHRLSPPDQYLPSTSTSTTTNEGSPLTIRPRRSFANLGQQKTSASTAVSQVNTAAGQFLGKQPVV